MTNKFSGMRRKLWFLQLAAVCELNFTEWAIECRFLGNVISHNFLFLYAMPFYVITFSLSEGYDSADGIKTNGVKMSECSLEWETQK